MNMTLGIYFGVLVFLIVWLVVVYNGLVKMRQLVRESWSGIDTELKRRYDLIPNLMEAVKGYAKHEKELFAAVTEARANAVASDGDTRSQARDERELVNNVRRLMAVAESYPQLKASEHFLDLQNELANTEDRIQAARRFFNANVRDLNTRVEVFPSNIVASVFQFTREDYFEVEKAVIRNVVDISFP